MHDFLSSALLDFYCTENRSWDCADDIPAVHGGQDTVGHR